ncbi:hypothetical protein C7Y66_27540 [Chroococcidiopsis sp. CCALA 051]|uniref:hypothetical protein n=1 Tax=Chroococcidiopsis sp. CCALA 051 TaxID=869949 RepID=UPI000D0CBB12|nr:hypothetical protein [Chroococcidiopsis sp. CCALA 051]MBE9014566.1 hypothetical protein [Chroococcidiopsidales cyanobacterium LEGE 13417]PSM45960.1 hypothetical protein C7Y66_27540 [Chroococcidiopsis sp. CCALA 051]
MVKLVNLHYLYLSTEGRKAGQAHLKINDKPTRKSQTCHRSAHLSEDSGGSRIVEIPRHVRSHQPLEPVSEVFWHYTIGQQYCCRNAGLYASSIYKATLVLGSDSRLVLTV